VENRREQNASTRTFRSSSLYHKKQNPTNFRSSLKTQPEQNLGKVEMELDCLIELTNQLNYQTKSETDSKISDP